MTETPQDENLAEVVPLHPAAPGNAAETQNYTATTTTPPVVVWAPLRAAKDLRDALTGLRPSPARHVPGLS